MHHLSMGVFPAGFRIAVAGGGPGGLTLARILQTRGIPVTVFESDDHPLIRPQGGTLDIHADEGQLALRMAGVYEGFLKIARYDDQGARLLDREGRVIFAEQNDESDASRWDRPEVDRTLLRQLLIESLPPEVIRWGRRLRRVEERTDGAFDLFFHDGGHETFDFVVGADGAWSKVRPLLTEVVPTYCGVTFVETGFDHAPEAHPGISESVGRGKMFALDGGKGILAQRNGDGHIRAYFAFRTAEDWITNGPVEFSSTARTREGLMHEFAGWSPSLQAFIQDSDDWFVPRALYALPAGHCWTHRDGVTLLGDASHLMSPFGGFGVNFAMLDAAELAVAIEQGLISGSREAFEQCIAAYERRMCERAAPAAEGAQRGLLEAFSEEGFRHVFDHISGATGPH